MGHYEIKGRKTALSALVFAFLALLPFAYFYVTPMLILIDCSDSGKPGHKEIPGCAPK